MFNSIQNDCKGFLAVQWLRLPPSTTSCTGSIPGQGTNFLQNNKNDFRMFHCMDLLLLLLLLLSRFSRVRLCATPETAAHQAPPSLEFSGEEHWSGTYYYYSFKQAFSFNYLECSSFQKKLFIGCITCN